MSSIIIKQARVNNIGLLKIDMSLVDFKLLPWRQRDSSYLLIRINSLCDFQATCYYFITEVKTNGIQQHFKYDKASKLSRVQQFRCPKSDKFEIPSNHLMINKEETQFIKSQQISNGTLYHFILELVTQFIHQNYLVNVNTNEYLSAVILFQLCLSKWCSRNETCQRANLCNISKYKNEVYELNELYGIDNTVFNKQWDPNTNESKECVVCFTNSIDTIILPCRHMCVCLVCCTHIANSPSKLCPLCRKDINNYLTIDYKNQQLREQIQSQIQRQQLDSQHQLPPRQTQLIQEEEEKELIIVGQPLSHVQDEIQVPVSPDSNESRNSKQKNQSIQFPSFLQNIQPAVQNTQNYDDSMYSLAMAMVVDGQINHSYESSSESNSGPEKSVPPLEESAESQPNPFGNKFETGLQSRQRKRKQLKLLKSKEKLKQQLDQVKKEKKFKEDVQNKVIEKVPANHNLNLSINAQSEDLPHDKGKIVIEKDYSLQMTIAISSLMQSQVPMIESQVPIPQTQVPMLDQQVNVQFKSQVQEQDKKQQGSVIDLQSFSSSGKEEVQVKANVVIQIEKHEKKNNDSSYERWIKSQVEPQKDLNQNDLILFIDD